MSQGPDQRMRRTLALKGMCMSVCKVASVSWGPPARCCHMSPAAAILKSVQHPRAASLSAV